MTIEIRNTYPYDLRMMAEAMTADSKDVAERIGMPPLKLLWSSYRNSIICKSGFIDGKLAAIFGISGSMLAETGRPFLIMTPEVKKHPIRVAFIYRRFLKEFQNMFPVLEEWVPIENEDSIRLLELMNFHVSKNEMKVGGQVFRRAERRVVW